VDTEITMKVRTALVALVLVLAVTGSADATAFLWTPPLHIDSGQYVRCSVTNVSNYEIRVGAEAFDAAGSGTVLYGNYTLAPRRTVSFWSSTSPSVACRFTVPSASYVRANACVGTFNSFTCLAQVDAR
jgi:hypothetical protein